MPNPSLDNDPQRSVFTEFKAQINTAKQSLDADHQQLAAQLEPLNRIFQSQVQAFEWGEWPTQQRSLLQSLRVEMHKQLRLLTTDLMFLKAAKQAETLEQRRREIGDRLTSLEGYCDAVLKLTQNAIPSD